MQVYKHLRFHYLGAFQSLSNHRFLQCKDELVQVVLPFLQPINTNKKIFYLIVSKTSIFDLPVKYCIAHLIKL